MDYPYVRAWCRIALGWEPGGELEEAQVELARRSGVCSAAVWYQEYRGRGIWHTMDYVRHPEMLVQLEEAAAEIRAGTGE